MNVRWRFYIFSSSLVGRSLIRINNITSQTPFNHKLTNNIGNSAATEQILQLQSRNLTVNRISLDLLQKLRKVGAVLLSLLLKFLSFRAVFLLEEIGISKLIKSAASKKCVFESLMWVTTGCLGQ